MKVIGLLVWICLFELGLYAQSSVWHRVTDPAKVEWEMGDKVGYADEGGNMVIPFGKYRYCYSEEFDRIAFVGLFDRQGIYAIDRNENVLFEIFICDNGPDKVNEGLFRIVRNGKTGFADTLGKVIIGPEFDCILPFSEGLAIFGVNGRLNRNGDHLEYIGGKWGFIDKQGKQVQVPAYDALRSFRDGMAFAEKDGKWGTIDRTGKVIIPIKYTFDEIIKMCSSSNEKEK